MLVFPISLNAKNAYTLLYDYKVIEDTMSGGVGHLDNVLECALKQMASYSNQGSIYSSPEHKGLYEQPMEYLRSSGGNYGGLELGIAPELAQKTSEYFSQAEPTQVYEQRPQQQFIPSQPVQPAFPRQLPAEDSPIIISIGGSQPTAGYRPPQLQAQGPNYPISGELEVLTQVYDRKRKLQSLILDELNQQDKQKILLN